MPIQKCRMCEHAIFDPVWGQYKCKRLAHTIADAEQYTTCEYYNKNPNAKPTITKRWTVK